MMDGGIILYPDLDAELAGAREHMRGAPECWAEICVHEDVRVWGWAGRDRIQVDNMTGLYRPDPEGRWAYITPVKAGDPLDAAEDVIRFGDIVDLVAWHPRRPFRWVLRTGAGFILGHAEWGTTQLIYPNPFLWLRDGGRGGVCVLQSIPLESAA